MQCFGVTVDGPADGVRFTESRKATSAKRYLSRETTGSHCGERLRESGERSTAITTARGDSSPASRWTARLLLPPPLVPILSLSFVWTVLAATSISLSDLRGDTRASSYLLPHEGATWRPRRHPRPTPGPRARRSLHPVTAQTQRLWSPGG